MIPDVLKRIKADIAELRKVSKNNFPRRGSALDVIQQVLEKAYDIDTPMACALWTHDDLQALTYYPLMLHDSRALAHWLMEGHDKAIGITNDVVYLKLKETGKARYG